MAARRTAAAGTSAALATASAITPSSAPWRSSPPSSRRRNVCSASVAWLNSPETSSARRACDPLPATVPISLNRASTSRTVSDGSVAGEGNERNAAQPTPICRCGSSPDSHDTTTATSFGSLCSPACRSRSAILAILASRAEEAPTSADAVATSSSCTTSAWHARQTSPSMSVSTAASARRVAARSSWPPRRRPGAPRSTARRPRRAASARICASDSSRRATSAAPSPTTLPAIIPLAGASTDASSGVSALSIAPRAERSADDPRGVAVLAGGEQCIAKQPRAISSAGCTCSRQAKVGASVRNCT